MQPAAETSGDENSGGVEEENEANKEERKEGRKDLLRRDLLDNYIFRLNRHPGRRVDAAVSRSEQEGGIVLDYLITENRPLIAYFQVSNTGTEQTDEWRERFGIVHNQFTGNDDILSIDYTTAGFDETHSVVTSYEAPLFGDERIRWRLFGSWGEFTATDVGAVGQLFTGDNWSIGGELIANFAQDRELFLDFVFGVRLEHIFVNNEVALLMGEDEFFIVYMGLNAERITEISRLLASITVERNIPSVGNTEDSEIIAFGRTNPEDRWTLLKWNVSHSAYLEPFLNAKAWRDVSTPETSTLAHELAFTFKGQHSFGARLIPQMEQAAGGLYTVRGLRRICHRGGYRRYWQCRVSLSPSACVQARAQSQ